MMMPFMNRNMKIPLIKIIDKASNMVRMVGTDCHDKLAVNKNGQIQYNNSQNGEGTGCQGDYSFFGMKFVSIEKLQEIASKHAENIKENERKIAELITFD